MKILTTIALVMAFITTHAYSDRADTATIVSVRGDVRLISLGSNIGVACEEGMTVRAGDWIKTGVNSTAKLAFDNDADNVISVQEKSLVIMRLDGYFRIQLLAGRVNAILENVRAGEIFRVLTPSVVAESTNSGWVVSSDGDYSTVVVIEGEAYVVGINRDGSIKKTRYGIREGYARTTRLYEDPGEIIEAPESVIRWFKDQVVEHHLEKVLAQRPEEHPELSEDIPADINGMFPVEDEEILALAGTERTVPPKGRTTAIIDGEKVDLLEFIYKSRLGPVERKDSSRE